MKSKQRFAPYGSLALDPSAFGMIFDVCEDNAPGPEISDGGTVVVCIRGPLMHRKEWYFDSYDSIRERMAQALALGPKRVVLSIDSPGGVVSGAFDTARELRRMATDAGAELFAHVDGMGTSAAYALASAASWIGVSQTSVIGSIGVIDGLVDTTAQAEMHGVRVQIITSGARKGDGHPNVPITDGAIEATQNRVDSVAEMFFDLVSEHGWGESPEALRAMQAGMVHGAEAVDLKLASAVATLEDTIGLPEQARMSAQLTEGNETMPGPMDDAKAALRKAAESDDEEEARAAKAALKALGEDEPDAEGDDEPDAEDDDKPDAEGDDEPDAEGDDDDDKPDAKAEGDDDEEEASAMAVARAALAQVHTMKARAAKNARKEKRSQLIASRPDFSPEMVKVLSKSSLSVVAKMCAELPRGIARADRVAAAATVTGTRGSDTGNNSASRLPKAEADALKLAMGMSDGATAVVHTPNKLSFGVRVLSAQNGGKK